MGNYQTYVNICMEVLNVFMEVLNAYMEALNAYMEAVDVNKSVGFLSVRNDR